jgi:hypothetical protein
MYFNRCAAYFYIFGFSRDFQIFRGFSDFPVFPDFRIFGVMLSILLSIHVSSSLPVNLQTPSTVAPAFTILRRQYKYAGGNTPLPPQIPDV